MCNKDPDQKQMDSICNSFLGPEIRAKYKSAKPGKNTKPKKPRSKKKKTTAGQNPGKVSKSSFLAEVPRSQPVDPGTELCGINNALICRKSTAASITTPLTTPSPRQIFTQRPQTRVTPKATQTRVTSKATQTRVTSKATQSKVTGKAQPRPAPNPRLKTTSKPKPGKAKSKSAKQNQISSRSKGKKGKSRWDPNRFVFKAIFHVSSRPSKGFVIASAQKRKQLRSYWMRRG